MSFWNFFKQSGGGSCSLCGSPGVTKATCPCNPKAKNPNPAKHPLAKKICPKIKKQARPKAKESIRTQKEKVALKADGIAAQPLEIIQEVLLQIDNESTIRALCSTSKRIKRVCEYPEVKAHIKRLSTPTRITEDGTKEWLDNDGELHREGDQPARIEADGNKFWYVHGEQHRNGDQPAYIGTDGTKFWYLHGKFHREGDQPARIWRTGSKEWWIDGKLHRDGDQPARIEAGGRKEWWVEGKLHRGGNQPAVIYAAGNREWWVHGNRVFPEKKKKPKIKKNF